MKWKTAFVTFLLFFAVTRSSGNDDESEADKSPVIVSPPIAASMTEAEIEADMAAIESLWSSFRAALQASDLQSAGQHIAPHSKERYVSVLEQMGSQMSEAPGRWSEFTPIRIGSDLAVYAFTQEELNGERLHTVTFVRLPEYGWLIQSW